MSLPHDAMIARIATLLGQGRDSEAEHELAAIRRDLPVQQATAALNMLLQQRADWVPALAELGRCMLQMQQHRAAFNIGAHITQLDGDDAHGVELQALAMEHGGAHATQVLPLRRRLVALRPDSVANQFLLAVTASRVGYYREMHAALDATLALDSSHLFARWAKILTP